ncbi:transposase [Aquimarina sp. MAR_2010_214]|uniref:transposase n=1 Tax=Aquimarina sp. MAR_2010_214 TaxID=1250026 RepID=UPI001304194C|nr:transposase [Aquimarina sp. MAR_2010_214]
MVIDNAAFHVTKNIATPKSIYLLRIPPYTPEFNPCGQIWQYIKQRFKDRQFDSLIELKKWLSQQVCQMKTLATVSIQLKKQGMVKFNYSVWFKLIK